MKNWTFLFVLFVFTNAIAQTECDCCNLYLLTNFKAWESFFPPSSIAKNNYETLKANYSFVDSNGVTQTMPLAVFNFNKKGYVKELKEYYRGIPNHKVKFDRKFKKRIKSTTTVYLDESGNELSNFGGTFTQYSYSKRTVKTKERPLNGEFLDDDKQSYQTVTYDSKGLRIHQFNQYHYENGSNEPYHSEVRSEFVFINDTTGIRNSYLGDSSWINERLILTDFGKEKLSEMAYATNPNDVIYRQEYQYNSNEQCVHIKSRTPNEGIATECQDKGEFDIYYNYEDNVLKSVTYTYADTTVNITFSTQ